MAEDFDISNIDPTTLRDRPSLLARPTFYRILTLSSAVLCLIGGFLPSYSGWWSDATFPVREAVELFILGLCAGVAYTLYYAWDLRTHQFEWALQYATRWPRSLSVRRANWGLILVLALLIVVLRGPGVLFPKLPGTIGLVCMAGFILPSIFLGPRLKPVYQLSWQIIRQVKAKQVP